MPLHFKGTFNKSQLDRLVSFLRSQTADVVARIEHLSFELLRLGALSFSFDQNGIPTTYVAGNETYIGKLVAAYEVLGGDPFFDLNVRTGIQAVFLETADETRPAQRMSNGEIMGLPGLADAVSAELLDTATLWSEDVVARLDHLERKIRRSIDYAEQLQQEIELLTLTSQSSDQEGSLENTVSLLLQLIQDPNYRAIYDDKGKDPMGKLVYAPYLPYSLGPDRAPSDLYGRDAGDTGAVVPGETLDET